MRAGLRELTFNVLSSLMSCNNNMRCQNKVSVLFTHQWPTQRRLTDPAAAVWVLHIKHLRCWGESSSYFPSGQKSLTLPRAKHHSALAWLECMIMSCMFLNQSPKKMCSCLLLASMYFSRDSLLMNLFPCSSSSLAAYLCLFPHQSQRVEI